MLKYFIFTIFCCALAAQAGGNMSHPTALKGFEVQREAHGRTLRLEHPTSRTSNQPLGLMNPQKGMAPQHEQAPKLNPRAHPAHRSAMHF